MRTAIPFSVLAATFLVSACGGDDPGGVRAADCAACHSVEATAFEIPSSHSILFDCTFCHEELSASPGPGHRAITWCDRCHSEAGHPPAGIADGSPGGDGDDRDQSCATCHEPHGSANLFLIRPRIPLPEGDHAEVVFLDLTGQADFSYAELATADGGANGREPGEGLCEVCHTQTTFYDRWGTGDLHSADRCVRCHDHARGFAAR